MRFGIMPSCLVVAAVAFCASTALGAASFDTGHVTYQKIDPSTWQHTPDNDVLWIVGDPKKPGLCIQLIHWLPGKFSQPHFHSRVRFATVLSGTWWVGTGNTQDIASTKPMPAGTFVTDIANTVHYDGAKPETGDATIEVVMECPLETTPVAGKHE